MEMVSWGSVVTRFTMGKMRSRDNLSNVADKKKIELTLFGRGYDRVIMGHYWVIGLFGHWVCD